MRLTLALALATTLSCGALHDPAPPKCPAKCPALCPNACLPDGTCASVTETAEQLGWSQIQDVGSVAFPVGDLPRDADVKLSFSLVLDDVQRNGQVPWPYWFEVKFDHLEQPVIEASDGNAVDLPKTFAFATSGRTDDTGSAPFDFYFTRCEGRASTTCTIGPKSWIRAEVSRPPAELCHPSG